MTDKVVVTGAAGFIGSFLTERLLKEGYDVVGLDNYFRGDKGNIDRIVRAYPSSFEFFEADITREIPPEIFRAARAVFHYAAINGTQHFYERPLDVLRVNVQGTVNVFDAAVRSGSVEKICFASSSEVYGEPSVIPTRESEPCVIPDVGNPRHSYSLSKMMGESYLLWFAKKYGISYLIFRIFNTYGPRMDSSSYGQVIPEFVRKIFFDREFTIIGDGSHRRSFCYVSDNVEFALRAFERVDNETLNVGNSNEVSVLELAELMHKIVGRDFSYKCLDERRGDIRRRSPDISKISSLTGYAPKVSLEEGLRIMLGSYREKWNLPEIVEQVAK